MAIINPHKLAAVLINYFGGERKYESITFENKREWRSAYCYLKKIHSFARISDHPHPRWDKRTYNIEIITSLINLDVAVNNFPLAQLPGNTKPEAYQLIINYLLNHLK